MEELICKHNKGKGLCNDCPPMDESLFTVKNKGGRPSIFTQELADKICAQLAQGYSLRTVCKSDDMPGLETIFRWIREDKEGFREQYARAKEESADALGDEILDIADDGSNDWMEIHKGGYDATVVDQEAVQRSKLRVDTRKWIMSKMKPKKYGDKLDVTSDGKAMPAPIYGGLSTKE